MRRRKGDLVRQINRRGRMCVPRSMIDGNKEGQEVELLIKRGRIHIKPFDGQNIRERESIGIVRMLDSKGRVGIPIEMLTLLGILQDAEVYCEMLEDEIRLIPIQEMDLAQ